MPISARGFLNARELDQLARQQALTRVAIMEGPEVTAPAPEPLGDAALRGLTVGTFPKDWELSGFVIYDRKNRRNVGQFFDATEAAWIVAAARTAPELARRELMARGQLPNPSQVRSCDPQTLRELQSLRQGNQTLQGQARLGNDRAARAKQAALMAVREADALRRRLEVAVAAIRRAEAAHGIAIDLDLDDGVFLKGHDDADLTNAAGGGIPGRT
jgi:hypothetical protein